MTEINRRGFVVASTSLVVGGSSTLWLGNSASGQEAERKKSPEEKPKGPVEADFERDYEKPKFSPSWKRKILNRTMVQDFVIFAHSDLGMVETLLSREPGLINGTMDWGNGDWESALGGASHMARKDIVEYLLSKGARLDIFCAAMLGMLDTVKQILTFQPELIDAPGPHGAFDLHHHANCAKANGEPQGKELLDFLQSIKEKEVRDFPFLKKKSEKKASGKKYDL